MSYLLFPSSGNHVTLEPEWDFDRRDAQQKSEHVTKSGKRYVYKWGSYVKFSFGVQFVNSATMSMVNSWFMTNTRLMFMENVSSAQVHSVMIVGTDLPIGQYQKPYADLFRGKIDLQGY